VFLRTGYACTKVEPILAALVSAERLLVEANLGRPLRIGWGAVEGSAANPLDL
jgi:hypothetical protein